MPLPISFVLRNNESFKKNAPRYVSNSEDYLLLVRFFLKLTNFPVHFSTISDLHKAAYKGDINELEELLGQEGNDVNMLGAQNRTPLHRAVGGKSAATTQYLIDKGATVNVEDEAGRTPLHWAAIVGSADCAEVLVKNGANVNPLTKTGKTPLHMGAEAGMFEFVKYILSAGADTTIKDSKQQSAYDLAKKGGHKEIMQLVKVKGEDPCCVVS